MQRPSLTGVLLSTASDPSEHGKSHAEHGKWPAEHGKWLAEHGKWLAEHSKWLAEHSKSPPGHGRELISFMVTAPLTPALSPLAQGEGGHG